MKYLVVAGPGYGKTSLVKGLNRLSGCLIAADLDCKGLKPPYASEGIMTRFVCDIFDEGYSLVTVHPRACDYEAVLTHCISKGEACKIVFALETSYYWLEPVLARIGKRDGLDSGFFTHMCECYGSVMSDLYSTALRLWEGHGDKVVTGIRMRGQVLSDFFGWSMSESKLCFGVPVDGLAFSHDRLNIAFLREEPYEESEVIWEISHAVSYISDVKLTKDSTVKVRKLLFRSAPWKAALGSSDFFFCTMLPMSEFQVRDQDESARLDLGASFGVAKLTWQNSAGSDGRLYMHTKVYVPDGFADALRADQTSAWMSVL